MDVIRQNTIKFIDALLVDNYSTAHKFLEVVVNEKIKQKISEAAKNENPFGKKSKDNEKGKKGKKGKLPSFIQKAIDKKKAKAKTSKKTSQKDKEVK